ncbi:Pre-rRNA-processing protein ipi3 [Orbilia oligospora]|uniref:Pre-rRNA-processing protein IPI3 n=1 Tax=Orbilia oligospora TaxID=2813651 RepID=A0A7C8TZZ7_ORBOL|nr:Pre-rRNA-processing protein ipi3 [Orbilia oligospora]
MTLTELVAISSHPPSSSGASASPEAYISIHDLHSFTQTSTFKKSCTPSNSLAISPTHIFAAQSDKTVLNVYNRTKNSLETTVPLPEQLTAVTCSSNGGIVAMGTASGRVNIWETSSGRYTSTPLSHLQKITSISIDPTSTFLLTGSLDTNILVWSIPHLLLPSSAKKPLRTLEYHQQPIISVLCGHGTGPSALAISAAADSSVIVWNYQDGSLLRTFTLSSVPTCLAFDPVDRGFYVGFSDGSIQQVEFSKVGNRTVELGNGTTSPAESSSGGDGERSYDSPLYRADERHIPIATSGNGSKWTAEGHDTAVTTMDVVFQGNYLVAGTESGSVNVWDAATGQLFRTLTTYKAPISNVKILPPTGFSEDTVTTSQLTIIPPRYHEAVKASSGNQVDVDTTLPPMSLQFHNALNPTPDPFSPASDLDAIKRGIAYFNSPATANSTNSVKGDQITITEFKSSEDAEKIETLEKELATMKERYKRLNEVHKQTWEEHTKWVMEVDKEKAEKMKEMGPEGMEE